MRPPTASETTARGLPRHGDDERREGGADKRCSPKRDQQHSDQRQPRPREPPRQHADPKKATSPAARVFPESPGSANVNAVLVHPAAVGRALDQAGRREQVGERIDARRKRRRGPAGRSAARQPRGWRAAQRDDRLQGESQMRASSQTGRAPPRASRRKRARPPRSAGRKRSSPALAAPSSKNAEGRKHSEPPI